MDITLDNQKVLSTGALVLAILILLAALGIAMYPKPNTDAQIASLKKQSADSIYAGKKANESAKAQQQASLALTWSGTGNEIGPAAFAYLNKIANGLNVKIESFRSQRTIDAGDVSQLPYVLVADGSFVNILQFVHKIETTPSKLAVDSLQLGSSDESSDQVTATVGLDAYILNTVSDDSTTSTTTGTSSTKSTTKAAPNTKIVTKPTQAGSNLIIVKPANGKANSRTKEVKDASH